LSTCLSGCLATDTKIEREIRAFQQCIMQGQNLARFFKFKTLVFGDTVTKKDFTATFKSKKEEVF
jgi:hypothetical protein